MKRARKLKTGNSRRATGNRTPLDESIIPMRENRKRDWASLTDEKLVRYVKKFMEENGVSGRKELERSDRGLYTVLRKRALLDRIRFVEKKRSWKKMKDVEIIERAKIFMEEKGISGRGELDKADSGLYAILRLRGLLDRVGFKEKWRSWKKMGDKQLIRYVRRFIKEKGITGRKELFKKDGGLYYVLWKRGLLDRVGFEEKRQKMRSWKEMDDEEMIEHARKFMKENGISGRKELEKADPGLHMILRKRRLLERVGFKSKKRSWTSMNNEKVIEHTKKIIQENGISSRKELEKADRGLYQVLRRRGLLERVGLERKHRSWKEMDDGEIIEYARKFMKENGISGRKELEKTDQGLYNALKLRGLMDKIGFETKRKKCRPWNKMKDTELIEYAKRIIKEIGLSGRKELRNADQGLYSVLFRRKLLNSVFSSLEQSHSERAIEQIIDFTASFGERR